MNIKRNWKIVKEVFMYDKQFKTGDVMLYHIKSGEPLYNCYRRKWGVFWVLKKQMTKDEYNKLVTRVQHDGYDFDSLYKRVNF